MKFGYRRILKSFDSILALAISLTQEVIYLELENLGQHRRGRFWIDNVPPIKYEIIEMLTSSITPAVSYPSRQHNAIALELMLPRHSSSYVLLGVRFEQTDEELVNIQVGLSYGCRS